MEKNWGTLLSLSLAFILLTASISLADVSQLLATRDAYGRPWVRACNGTVCSDWTPLSGILAEQPTVVWDEDDQKYYLYGIVSDGTIWRCSFSPGGVWANDWVNTGGSSAYPIAAASGGRYNVFNVSQTSTGAVTQLNPTTATNIVTLTNVLAPDDGSVVCQGSGVVGQTRSSSTGTSGSRIYISTTPGGTASFYVFTEFPSGTPTGDTSVPFAVTRSFNVTAGDYNYYLTGMETGTAASTTDTNVYNAALTCQYFAVKD